MPCGNTHSMPAPDVLSPRLGRVASRTRRRDGWREISVPCTCANGLSFDVIVGEDSECWPKTNKGPWSHVEVIGLNRTLRSLDRYRYTAGDGVMGAVKHHRVPIVDLNRLIARNGGLVI